MMASLAPKSTNKTVILIPKLIMVKAHHDLFQIQVAIGKALAVQKQPFQIMVLGQPRPQISRQPTGSFLKNSHSNQNQNTERRTMKERCQVLMQTKKMLHRKRRKQLTAVLRSVADDARPSIIQKQRLNDLNPSKRACSLSQSSDAI